MIKTNYHTHTLYCNHAEGYVEDYVKKAIELGFTELGMTDHAPILRSFMTPKEYSDNWCEENMTLETAEIYLNEIKAAQKKYGNKLSILSGFETEYIPEGLKLYKELRNKVDYLNLGVHYYRYKGKILNTYFDLNPETLEGYVDTIIEAIDTGLFNVCVHPDLFMYQYKGINGKREFDESAINASRRILKHCEENNVYVEVNCNGVKYQEKLGYDDYPYPVKEFWILAKEYKNLKILIGADAHTPDALGNDNVCKICEFVKDLGLNICDNMEINH